MAISKGIGGYAFNSQALIADAVHSLSDLISDVLTLATTSYSIRSPTSRFPTGYGKIESLGALGVSGILLGGGIMIGLQAIVALTQQFFPAIAEILSSLHLIGHGHSHSHGAEDFGPNINAAWLAGGSILIKEWLYRTTMKVALDKKSSVLASNAYHHRVDSLTAFVALATICASGYLNNAQWLDPVGGLIISGMIVQAGYGNTKNALLELADVGIEDEVKQGAEDAATAALDGTDAQFSMLQGIKSGQNFLLEVAVAVPDNWTLQQMKDVEAKVRQQVAENVKGVKRVAVRFVDSKSASTAFSGEFVNEEGGHAHSHEHTHDHDHDHDHGHQDSKTTANGGVTKRR